MVAAVSPYIDSGISKTVNIAEDYPYADFERLYFRAWKAQLKGLATYRPNPVLGSVLSAALPATRATAQTASEVDAAKLKKGALCRECGNYAVIRKDGCDFCSECGWAGVCE